MKKTSFYPQQKLCQIQYPYKDFFPHVPALCSSAAVQSGLLSLLEKDDSGCSLSVSVNGKAALVFLRNMRYLM